jgi:hypothetical protein
MTDSPRIAAMGRTLVDRGIDLGSDRAVILCLIGAGYDARDVEDGLDLAIAFAQRIYDARQTLAFDATVRAISGAMAEG